MMRGLHTGSSRLWQPHGYRGAVPGTERPLRLLISAPVYWPSTAFGGPIHVARSLVAGLAERGHDVDVFTSSLVELGRAGSRRTEVRDLDGARIHYAAT